MSKPTTTTSKTTSSSKTTTTKFASDGFDLDALTLSSLPSEGLIHDNNNVIYELDGTVSVELGTTTTTNDTTTTTNTTTTTTNDNDTRTKSTTTNAENSAEVLKTDDTQQHPLTVSEQYKKEGNDYFIKHMWKEALVYYTKAIDSVPYNDTNDNTTNTNTNDTIYTGEKLLQLQSEWDLEQGRLARQRLQQRDELERQKRQQQIQKNDSKRKGSVIQNDEISKTINDDKNTNNTEASTGKQQEQQQEEEQQQEQFKVPYHPYASSLSVYHCNRAAALLQLEQEKQLASTSNSTPWKPSQDFGDNDTDDTEKIKVQKKNDNIDSAIRDCTIAILFQPDYVKALLRRATAYERIDQTDRALDDTKQALTILQQQSGNDTKSTQYKSVQASILRLQKIEDERLEKLKTETFAKLKDLGNSILGNFGLSMDNFQAKQDPNTGSYSISFNNSK